MKMQQDESGSRPHSMENAIEAYLAAASGPFQSGNAEKKEKTTLYKDWLNDWLELYIKVSTKERTYKKYRQQVEKYILPQLGDYELDALSPVTLQRFSVWLTRQDLAPSSVNFVVALLKSSLKQGMALGVVDRQFADVIVRPKIRTSKIACFAKEEQAKIEQYIFKKQEPNLFGVLMSLYTGLRIGELLALTWEDVDLGRGICSVSRSCHDSWKNGRYVKVFDTTKTENSTRTIPLPRQILKYMRTLKRKTNSKFVVVGKTEYGAQIRSYQRTFSNILKKLRIAHRGFHALRHTFATRALECGMDVKTLSEILGHRDPTVTLMRYAHSLMEHKSMMMNRVARQLP